MTDIEIIKYISSQNGNFYEYLKNHAIKSELLPILESVSREQHVYILSGIIRDFFLNRATKIRDLDFVFEKDLRILFQYKDFIGNTGKIRLNSFKGLKINIKGYPSIDVWKVSETWGIKNKKIKKPNINALIESVFFNFSAIVYDLKERKFIFSQPFVNFLKTHKLDVVYSENPDISLCLFNIYYYSKEYDLGIASDLRDWIKSNYSKTIDFDSVQIKHLGKTLFSPQEINNYLSSFAMTYGIDWNKYLSTERFRESEINRKDQKIDLRNDFDSDFGRVVFSASLRRMHDKTQVIPLTSGDKVHTRLTHSIEVMNTAKSLAIDLCRDKDFIAEYGEKESYELENKISPILMSAALVHDIGNPPFGHFGETIIKDFFRSYLKANILKGENRLDFEEYDGNAQGLRILTHLSYVGDLAGLNLTYATLGAYLKYPNPGKPDSSYIGTKKHGIFSSEKEIFEKVADACSLRDGNRIKRHPLSFLVEAADSISYLAMDIEDGYQLKWYDKKLLTDFLDREITKTIQNFEKDTGKKLVGDEYKNSSSNLYSYDKVIRKKPSFIQTKKLNDNDWILKFRIATIQYLVELASTNFKKHARAIDNGTYSKELIEDDPLGVARALQSFTRRHILSQPVIQKVELTGHSVIEGLLKILIEYVCHSNPSFRQKVKNVVSKSSLKTAIHEQGNFNEIYHYFSPDQLHDYDILNLSEYSKLRLVVDFISGMTDKFAVTLYQELIGIKI